MFALFYAKLFQLFEWMFRLFGKQERLKPISVNYHFTRQCNYSCGFCFHTATSSHVERLEEAKRGLKLLAEAGMRKINFAGGEPFLKESFLGKLVKYCKVDLDLYVSIVSNGSLIEEKWFEQYGTYLDMLAVSCDSFDEETNVQIGRCDRSSRATPHIEKVKQVADWCKQYDITFKLNTVVNSFNWQEDMNKAIEELQPVRWKVFQVLELKGENSGPEAKRQVAPFLITDEQFKHFLATHNKQECLVPEDNDHMKNSYLILDEQMRFLNCSNGAKEPSTSILQVGVEASLLQSGFDFNMFKKRGGMYDTWYNTPTQCQSRRKELEW